MSRLKQVCLLPRLSGVGGMVSFQYKLAAGLGRRGIQVAFDLAEAPEAPILVIGGTRQVGALWRARRAGRRIVQRLDGMNWLHRATPRLGGSPTVAPRTRLRHYLRAEYGNLLLSAIRRRLAHAIAYQSQFSQQWWERERGETPVPCRVIYNGVDLQAYSPDGPERPPQDRVRLLLVEGSLMGGYETGLQAAVQLGQGLAQRLRQVGPAGSAAQVELCVVGRVDPQVRAGWDQRVTERGEPGFSLRWAGLAPGEQIPALDRSAHLLYSADLNAACPNSVIEALACGLPVVAFATGALPELVAGKAGRVVPYGGDPWRLDPPDMPALVAGAAQVLAGGDQFRQAARLRAEAAFGLEPMVSAYLEMLEIE